MNSNDIEIIGGNRAVNKTTGEVFFKEEVWKRNDQVVKLIDVRNQKNVKHVKFRVSREQKRAYDKLSMNEAGLLFKLMPYMCWETNLLVGDGVIGDKNKPLSWAQIDRILDCSKPHRIKLVKVLEEKKMIGYLVIGGKRVGIVINPKYAINGYKPSESLLQAFEMDQDVFEEEGED